MTAIPFCAYVTGNTIGIVQNYDAITVRIDSTAQITIATTGQQANGCSWLVEGYAA